MNAEKNEGRFCKALQLNCPACGEQHIDRGEWATRLHKTHLCEKCGHLWRPFAFATVGVP